MINANEARELVNQYNVQQEGRYQQAAQKKLETVSEDIEANARIGLTTLRYADRVTFFHDQRVEEIVCEELNKLGYEVKIDNRRLLIKW